MCGVVGLRQNEFKKHCFAGFVELFKQSTIRGLHSFGFTMCGKNGLHYTVKFSNLERALNFLTNEAQPRKPLCIIGHSRYSTSGDFLVENNNQPLVVSYAPNLALAFNGNIHMGTKAEYEAEYRSKFETANDGEIFLKKYLNKQDVVSWVLESKIISFAGLVLDGPHLRALRNEKRPLYFFLPDETTIMYASTLDIFDRAGVSGDSCYPVPAGEWV